MADYKLNRSGAQIDADLEKIESLKSYPIPYKEIQKCSNYLYSIEYNGIDEDWALNYIRSRNSDIEIAVGGCSGVFKDSLVGRNFDWPYSRQVEFAIQVEGSRNHYGYHGIASHSNLLENIINKYSEIDGAFDDNEKRDLRLLPFFMQDGENDYGLYMQINVTPLRENEHINIIHDDAVASVCEYNIPSYILAHCKTFAEAKEVLANKLNIYGAKMLSDIQYKSHYLLCDKKNNYCVVELTNDGVSFIDKPYLTNFGLDGVAFPSNNLVPTPGNGEATSIGIYKYGAGLERWNHIVNNYDSIENVNDMRNLMNDLFYSKAYTDHENPDTIWYTEFVDGSNNRTVDSPRADYAEALQIAAEEYEHRDRDNPVVWITNHSVVYDLNNKTMSVISQEDKTRIYIFELSTISSRFISED